MTQTPVRMFWSASELHRLARARRNVLAGDPPTLYRPSRRRRFGVADEEETWTFQQVDPPHRKIGPMNRREAATWLSMNNATIEPLAPPDPPVAPIIDRSDQVPDDETLPF